MKLPRNILPVDVCVPGDGGGGGGGRFSRQPRGNGVVVSTTRVRLWGVFTKNDEKDVIKVDNKIVFLAINKATNGGKI